MKIIGLMIVKNEDDILKVSLDHASNWLDGVVVLDNGSTDRTKMILNEHPIVLEWKEDTSVFDESKMVPKLISMADKYKADWYLDYDADEFSSLCLRHVCESVSPEVNVITVNIKSILNSQCYRIQPRWRRLYRNTTFDFSELKQLHAGKIPITKSNRVEFNSNLNTLHYQVRSFEQGMRKYENYKKIDSEGIQESYEPIRERAEALNTGDYSRITWVS